MKRSRKYALGAFSVVGFSCCYIYFASLTHPEGRFNEPNSSIIGYHYYKFHGGQVEEVFTGGRASCGTYRKEGQEWVWTTRAGNKLHLRPSWKELRLFGPDGVEDSSSHHRRWLIPPELKWSLLEKWADRSRPENSLSTNGASAEVLKIKKLDKEQESPKTPPSRSAK